MILISVDDGSCLSGVCCVVECDVELLVDLIDELLIDSLDIDSENDVTKSGDSES